MLLIIILKKFVNIFFKNNNEVDYLEKYLEGKFYKVVFFLGFCIFFYVNYLLLISINCWDFSFKIMLGENLNICVSLRIFDI